MSDTPILYGKYRICRNDFRAHHRWREVQWLFAHEDYDGGYYDAEGVACEADPRCGYGATVDDCITQIDDIEADIAESPREVVRAQLKASVEATK